MDALRGSHTPVLLIHGLSDDNIEPRQVRTLHAANPSATEVWEVSGAGHVASLSVGHAAYQRRVLDWFSAHRVKAEEGLLIRKRLSALVTHGTEY